MKQFSLIFLLLLTVSAGAQQQITGSITDHKGNPVSFANVYLDGSYDGTTTDTTGAFKLSTTLTGRQVIIASFIGFEKQLLEVDLNRLVIPLSLQMLVENAIKHNEISREHPLVIGITSTGNGHVIVKNNLQRRKVSETSLGTGLENLRKQITYFSSDPLLVLEEADAFIVRMPTVSGNTGVR